MHPNVANSQQLVLYNPNHVPENAMVVRKVSTGSEQHQQQQHLSSSHLGLRLKIREDDIRRSYKVLPILVGTGSFGAVRLCLHRRSKTKLAVKSITLTVDNSTLVKNEVALLQRINHRHVIRVVDVIKDRQYIHIIMEQCRGKDLFDVITADRYRPNESWARNIVASILDVVAYLHARDIVHRDLKAEHIVFKTEDLNSPIKIIDFGVATVHRSGDAPLTAFAGSVRSVAPEIIQGKYSRECDLWSLGVIVFFLLTQEMPFDGPSSDRVFQQIVSGIFYYPQWTATGLTEEVKHFIDHLLVVNPWRRMTAKEAMSHSWIRGKQMIRGNQMREVVKRPQTKRRQVY